MKRAKRQKWPGVNGRQRRRLKKILRAVAKGWGPGNWARTPCEIRDARRLAEAGKVVAVVSKSRPWKPMAEVTLFPTLEAALKEYPRYCVLPGKRPV